MNFIQITDMQGRSSFVNLAQVVKAQEVVAPKVTYFQLEFSSHVTVDVDGGEAIRIKKLIRGLSQ